MKKTVFLILAVLLTLMLLFAACDEQPGGSVEETTVSQPEAHIHTFDEWEIVRQPTCLDAGEKVRYCSCGEKQTEVIAALGHTEIADAAVAATCEQSGLTEGSHCSVCNEVLVAQQETPKTNHTEAKIEAVAATCSAEGATEGVKCSVCNEILVAPQPTSKVAHIEETISAVPATCANTGLTEGKKCSVCGTITVAQEPIEKLPHTEETIVGTAATCSATGLTDGKKCSVCEEILVTQTVLPKTACNFVSVVTAPTCEEQGYTTHTCSMCKVSFVDTYVDELGHNWGDWEVSGSYTLRNCTNEFNCGKSQRITSISATYHGIRLLTGESVWKNDVAVTATLSDNSTIVIRDFTLVNDVMIVDGSNYVDVKYHTVSTTISVPAIWDNLPGATSSVQFVYDETESLENDAVTITGFTGSSTNVVIPSYIVIDGIRVPVRYIGDSAFADNDVIESVVIAPSIVNIGTYAFKSCDYLTTVTMCEGLQTISGGAFMGCPITELVIPNSVTTISTHCYYDWGDDVYDGAFENCHKLTSVTLGNKLLAIDREAFQNCTALTTVVIGERLETVGAYAFAGCSALKNVTISTGVTTIGDHAFANCTSLAGIEIASGVTTIEQYAFANCAELASINIPGNVESIGIYCFAGCERLETVTIEQGVKIISGGAFMGCPITELVIPNSVTTISTHCYYDWGDDVYDGAFENCRKLTSVTLGSNLLAIDRETFRNCTLLISVTIGERIESIGEYAFAHCTELEHITIPDNVTTIYDNAFEGCVYLKVVELGTGVNSVGSYAFAGCTDLTAITIPSNVTTLGNNVFNNCTALEHVTIEKSKELLRSFGSNIFNGCSNLDRIYYTGTASDWALITISEDNSYPLNVSPYYYSSSSPSARGNYWYYNSNGEIRVWNVNETSFKAEEYSEKFANSTFGSADTSYSSQFLNQLEGDSLFQARILIWEALHVATDSSWESKAISKKDIYKMAIYDLLVGEVNSQVNPLACIEEACDSYVYEYAKFLLGSDSIDMNALKQMNPTQYDYVKLVDNYFAGIDGAFEIFEMSANLYDALYVCAQYQALSDMDTYFYLVLMEISNDGSLPWELRDAASECAGCYRTATEAMLNKILLQEFASSTMQVLWNDFKDEAWQSVLGSVFPQYQIVNMATKGMMFLTNMGFNLDACNEAYYQLEAAVGLENALRNVVQNTLPDYYRYNYKDKSEYYMYAIDMYQTSVLLGFDYSNNLLSEHSNSVDVNATEKQAYMNMMAQINSMKQDKKNTYNNFEHTIENLYASYYS